MKRARYLELAKVADEICMLLKDRGVTPNEGCMVRRVAELQWDAMRATHEDLQERLTNDVCMEGQQVLADSI